MGSNAVGRLIEKGVAVPNPDAVTVGAEVDPDRISAEGVVLYPGCRIAGADTLIAEKVRLGTGGPVTVENCRIGAGTQLASGQFEETVFLGHNRVGPGAHFRKGTILEESASAAHCVGLKQTVLFPYVTLGSLINFCDCLMAGGTGRNNHSEVGSSFIHFNFTPNQDKATPSLIGDVPRGVMLDRPPIFLGGQGGMVGPCRVAFGTLTASGTILRKDVREEGRLLFEAPRRSFSVPNVPGLYRNMRRIVENNLHYIANLKALEAWYRHFRPLLATGAQGSALLEGLRAVLAANLEERVGRMTQFVEKLPESLETYKEVMGEEASSKLVEEKKELIRRWPEAAEILRRPASAFERVEQRERFLSSAGAETDRAAGYLSTVSALSAETRTRGTAWLQELTGQVEAEAYAVLPALAPKRMQPGDRSDAGDGR